MHLGLKQIVLRQRTAKFERMGQIHLSFLETTSKQGHMRDENKSTGENEELELVPGLTLFPEPEKVPDNSIAANPSELMGVPQKVSFFL